MPVDNGVDGVDCASTSPMDTNTRPPPPQAARVGTGHRGQADRRISFSTGVPLELKGVTTMITALRIGLLGAAMLSSADPPDIAGAWSGEDWGAVALNLRNPGEYAGGYSHTAGTLPGEIQLKWSPTEQRYNGTWRDGEDQFGELSLRLVGDEIRGAHTTDPKSKNNHSRPQLGDLTWTRGTLRRVAARVAAGPPPEPLDLTRYYQMPASVFERIRSHPWGVVPRGSQTLGNVPLAIGGMLCLWGEENAKAGQAYPEKIDDIAVRRKFDTLYVYHSAFYDSRDGSPVYHLTMQYEDGTSSMTTICYGDTPAELVADGERASHGIDRFEVDHRLAGRPSGSQGWRSHETPVFDHLDNQPPAFTRSEIDQSDLGERALRGLHPGDDHRAGQSAQSR